MRRLGKHHFAHLRAVAEGLPVAESAVRYLGITHRAEAAAAHRAVVNLARAVARRRGDSRWRLIGLQIEEGAAHSGSSVLTPSLDEWAAAEGLGDWSHADLQEMYAERFGGSSPRPNRRFARNERLRQRRLELFKSLEATAAEKPAATDLIEGWFELDLAVRMRAQGLLTLADLQVAIARGGRWWSGLHAVGSTKAERLAAHLAQLIGPVRISAPFPVMKNSRRELSGSDGPNRPVAVPGVGTNANDDQAAVHAWIAARSGSDATRRLYEREAERFILFCVVERDKAMSAANADDCQAYIEFLAKIPEPWISRRKVARMAPGWAPFRGQLSVKSRKTALDTLNSLFGWLVQARYLLANPWTLVSRKLGDDPLADDDPTSRAFTPAAWLALKEHLQARETGPSTARLRWICEFVEAVGLRSDELIRARRSHLVERGRGWIIKVHGKGSKNRVVPVPSRAIKATMAYFDARGLDFDEAGADAPLLASLVDGISPITYSSLYETFKRFVRNALRASSLPVDERMRAMRASAHWLRHTYATRSAESDVPVDIIQENLGQADPRTAAKYMRAQLERRQEAMERVFAAEAAE